MTVPHRPVQEYRFTWTKDNSGRLAKPRKDARLPPDPPLAEPREPQIDMGGLVRAIRRQVPLIAVCAGVGILGAVLMILGSVPRYTAVGPHRVRQRRDRVQQVRPLLIEQHGFDGGVARHRAQDHQHGSQNAHA
ncbi:MAG: hypothetical protein AAGG09_15535, partial [Pseudomonadota bacterium]